MKKFLLAVIMASVAMVALAQVPPVKNPSKLSFTSIDHAQATGYEVDILNGATGVLVQTLNTGKGTQDAAGVVTIQINVQPIIFGQYTFKVRAVAGAVKGDDSAASDLWERSPTSPSKPQVAR